MIPAEVHPTQWERKLDKACTLHTFSLHTKTSPTVTIPPSSSFAKILSRPNFASEQKSVH